MMCLLSDDDDDDDDDVLDTYLVITALMEVTAQ
jgi:hypothetical protein